MINITVFTVEVKRRIGELSYVQVKATSERGALRLATRRIKWEAGTGLKVVNEMTLEEFRAKVEGEW